MNTFTFSSFLGQLNCDEFQIISNSTNMKHFGRNKTFISLKWIVLCIWIIHDLWNKRFSMWKCIQYCFKLAGNRKLFFKELKMNFEDELHSCLFIFEVTGLQYFSLKKLLSHKSNGLEKWRVVYMLVLLLCIFSLAVSYVIHDHRAIEGNVTPKNVLMFAIQNTMNFGIIMVEIISLLQSYWSTRKIMKIYAALKEIVHLCFNDFKTFIDFTKIKERAWKRFRQMLAFIGVLHISLTLYHIKSTDAICQLFLGIIPLFFLTMVVNKFVFYVDLVNSLLEFLKYLLEDIFKYEPIKIISNLHSSTKTVKAPEDPMRKLRACWKIYMKIYDISGLINDSIGLTILVLLSSLVVTLTISGYEVFVIIVGGLPVKKFPGDCKRNFQISFPIYYLLFI